MSPEDRQRMIEGMVAGLASRLKTNGKDFAGWLRLVNAYVVLGRKDRASAAVADARIALADDAAALQKLDAQARKLGLKP
jgi:cytochrome c-type biogenesis protein CcmH